MPPRKRTNETIRRIQEKLRRHPLPDRTSTYREGSERALIGAAGEELALRWLQDELVCAGSDWDVVSRREAKERSPEFGPADGSASEAIQNSQHGDLYVYQRGQGLWDKPELLFSVEVKCSPGYENATISWHELTDSQAEFLLGVTRAGIWICTMDEARDKASRRESHDGDFYVVPYGDVRKLTGKEIIDEHKKGQDRRFDSTIDPDRIPF